MAKDKNKSLVLSYKFTLLKLQYVHGILIKKKKKADLHSLTESNHVKRNYNNAHIIYKEKQSEKQYTNKA